MHPAACATLEPYGPAATGDAVADRSRSMSSAVDAGGKRRPWLAMRGAPGYRHSTSGPGSNSEGRRMSRHALGIRAMGVAALALIAGATSAPAAEPAHAHAAAASERAPLFDNLGTYHRAITTRSPQAQRYFDQGMRLMWGFNLEEAQRSFEEASRLDSTCAMCAWGVAFSLGPHINLPGIPERTRPAFHAAEKAVSLESGASDVERALIDAMAKRYCDPPPADPKVQSALDPTYAAAMKEDAARFPDATDVLAPTVQGLMD